MPMQWFGREFQYPFSTGIYPAIVERLRGLPPRAGAKIETGSESNWTARRDGTWSAQENLGHLLDLEELWRGRLDEFLAGATVLRPADLQNEKTHAADHNGTELCVIVEDLAAARGATLLRLEALRPEDYDRISRHPRLDTPMRLVDHLFFVAEHDDHHLARIQELLGGDR